ncbi:MAG: hypothetical protein V1708_01430 [Candidatus Micrarchaeota archaeon]
MLRRLGGVFRELAVKKLKLVEHTATYPKKGSLFTRAGYIQIWPGIYRGYFAPPHTTSMWQPRPKLPPEEQRIVEELIKYMLQKGK